MYKFYEKLKRKKKYSKEFHQDVAEKTDSKHSLRREEGRLEKD